MRHCDLYVESQSMFHTSAHSCHKVKSESIIMGGKMGFNALLLLLLSFVFLKDKERESKRLLFLVGRLSSSLPQTLIQFPSRLDFHCRLSKLGISFLASLWRSFSTFFLPLCSGSQSRPHLSLLSHCLSLSSLTFHPIFFCPPAHWLDLSTCFLTPSAVTFFISVCLSPSLSILYLSVCLSLPPQGRGVCATAPECWTLRCWSVRLRKKSTQRWGCETWLLKGILRVLHISSLCVQCKDHEGLHAE